ncbi:hypothetical protein [Klebsiella pneumoniae]|uniref:hypothetical protein n=1 Tax=Klebsiella pneumoniae TaxID=573 RepID=UPI00117B40E4|nr:hypothetical protein [Klebsiella pneumoniae]
MNFQKTNSGSDKQKKVMEQDERRKQEEDERIAAEQEFLERFQRERKLSKAGPESYTSPSQTSSLADSESETDKKKKRTRISPNSEERKRAKTTKKDEVEVEDETEEETEEGNDPVKNMEKILKKMTLWFKQPTIMKMVTKPQTEKFERYLDEAREEVIRMRELRVRLETRVEERSALMDSVRTIVREELKTGKEKEEPTRIGSYAEMAAKKEIPKVSGMKGPVQPVPKLILIRQDNKESEEIKKMLK